MKLWFWISHTTRHHNLIKKKRHIYKMWFGLALVWKMHLKLQDGNSVYRTIYPTSNGDFLYIVIVDLSLHSDGSQSFFFNQYFHRNNIWFNYLKTLLDIWMILWFLIMKTSVWTLKSILLNLLKNKVNTNHINEHCPFLDLYIYISNR